MPKEARKPQVKAKKESQSNKIIAKIPKRKVGRPKLIKNDPESSEKLSPTFTVSEISSRKSSKMINNSIAQETIAQSRRERKKKQNEVAYLLKELDTIYTKNLSDESVSEDLTENLEP